MRGFYGMARIELTICIVLCRSTFSLCIIFCFQCTIAVSFVIFLAFLPFHRTCVCSGFGTVRRDIQVCCHSAGQEQRFGAVQACCQLSRAVGALAQQIQARCESSNVKHINNIASFFVSISMQLTYLLMWPYLLLVGCDNVISFWLQQFVHSYDCTCTEPRSQVDHWQSAPLRHHVRCPATAVPFVKLAFFLYFSTVYVCRCRILHHLSRLHCFLHPEVKHRNTYRNCFRCLLIRCSAADQSFAHPDAAIASMQAKYALSVFYEAGCYDWALLLSVLLHDPRAVDQGSLQCTYSEDIWYEWRCWHHHHQNWK